MLNDPNRRWYTSSYCSNNACVEVAIGTDTVGVRDNKPGNDRTVLDITPTAWRTFITGIRAGSFPNSTT